MPTPQHRRKSARGGSAVFLGDLRNFAICEATFLNQTAEASASRYVQRKPGCNGRRCAPLRYSSIDPHALGFWVGDRRQSAQRAESASSAGFLHPAGAVLVFGLALAIRTGNAAPVYALVLVGRSPLGACCGPSTISVSPTRRASLESPASRPRSRSLLCSGDDL